MLHWNVLLFLLLRLNACYDHVYGSLQIFKMALLKFFLYRMFFWVLLVGY